MPDDDAPTVTRQARLVARRKRYRWAGIFLAAAVVGAAGTVAAFAVTNETSTAGPDTPPPTATTVRPQELDPANVPQLTLSSADEFEFRPLSHEQPLELWVGGDSLAGALGPALGELTAATGIVDTQVDYKVSSGLATQVRNWPRHAEDAMADEDPEAVIFMIGANDATIVSSHDNDGDGVPDWEPDYRMKVARMMDLFLDDNPQRTLFWIGAPPMRTDSRNRGVIELNRVMKEEAEKRAPNVVYVDAYDLFADDNGEYTDTVELEDGGTIRVRIGDGVHLTPVGAEYLARSVFALLDGRFNINAQADPDNRIDYSVRSGGSNGDGGSGSGTGNNRPRSTTTVAPDEDDGSGDGEQPTASTAPSDTTPPSAPPASAAPAATTTPPTSAQRSPATTAPVTTAPVTTPPGEPTLDN